MCTHMLENAYYSNNYCYLTFKKLICLAWFSDKNTNGVISYSKIYLSKMYKDNKYLIFKILYYSYVCLK